jgi:hypothetical protein
MPKGLSDLYEMAEQAQEVPSKKEIELDNELPV